MDAVGDNVDAADKTLEIRAKRAASLRSGMSWMQAVGALSALNVIAAFSDFPLRLAIGVTAIDLIMAIGQEAGGTLLGIAIGISLVIAGALFGLAWGFKNHDALGWAPIPFIGFYALDTVLAVLLKDFIGVAFHALALYYIIGGYIAYRALLRERRAANPIDAPTFTQPVPEGAESPL